MLRRVKAEWAAVIIALLGMLLGGVAWGARLEERVDSQERDRTRLEDQVRDDLAYIRRRLDEALDRGGVR